MTALACLSLAVWLYLALLHSRFWFADQRITSISVKNKNIPSVVAVIPARDEADGIGRTVRSLLDQDYAGAFSIVVVDDNSTDGTADAAGAVLRDAAERARLKIVAGAPLPAGWVGKMWAVSQGVALAGNPDYLLLTDADIVHAPDALSGLVAKAEADGLGLVSLMVRLNCTAPWEKLLIPAFVYFFQKLYPFPRVNDSQSRVAAAAGGCMLVHRHTLIEAGGIESIRDALIDDCALARRIKPHRPIWLGLTEATTSLRVYDGLAPIWRMVARSAYVQLDHRPIALIGTVFGMLLLYVLPPLALVTGISTGDAGLAATGGAAWAVMAWTYLPTLELYRRSGFWAWTLPLAGMLYAVMTLDSARRHYAGRGGAWKGRTYGG